MVNLIIIIFNIKMHLSVSSVTNYCNINEKYKICFSNYVTSIIEVIIYFNQIVLKKIEKIIQHIIVYIK